MPKTQKKCSNCFYVIENWEVIYPDEVIMNMNISPDQDLVYCRRYPPSIERTDNILIEADYWCGEYKPQEEID